MILLIGSHSDLLLREAHRLCRESRETAMEVIQCEENSLFESCPFALEMGGRGFLRIDGRQIDLADVTGVLLRLPRVWWPSSEFDLADQMFVYHETLASWFALLSSLECLVVNRFGLGWWLQDLTYPLDLRASLSRALGMPSTALGADEPASDGRLWPTARVDSECSSSVYIAGCAVIPAPGCSDEIVRRLRNRGEAISAWQAGTGISLCRVDFERQEVPRLRQVEAYPLLEGETASLVTRIAAATLENITAVRGVMA